MDFGSIFCNISEKRGTTYKRKYRAKLTPEQKEAINLKRRQDYAAKKQKKKEQDTDFNE